jgi:hypothetical protein
MQTVVPSPMYPELQSHVKLPSVLVQYALVSQLLSVLLAHSSMSVLLVSPSPVYPVLQVQV